MMGGSDLQWAHALAAIFGAIIGAVSAIFTIGWRLGQAESKISKDVKRSVDEAQPKLEKKVDAINRSNEQSKKMLEDRVDRAAKDFEDTLKGMRQKINDVELGTEREFVRKTDFFDFREEYRQDMRDVKNALTMMGKALSDRKGSE